MQQICDGNGEPRPAAQPDIRYYFDSRWRGYLFCEVTPQYWRTDLRIVDDVENAASPGHSLARFCAEDGRAGAKT